jgi:membrane associated rhomboid family serine protease
MFHKFVMFLVFASLLRERQTMLAAHLNPKAKRDAWPKVSRIFPIDIARGLRHESLDECGCRLGSLAASITFIGYLALAIALPLLRGTAVTFSWWQALAALLGGALVGKTFGVLRASRLHERKAL